MKLIFLTTTILLASHQMAFADTTGHAALALGFIVGDDSPTLGRFTKIALARLLDDRKLGDGKHSIITVEAKSVVCQAGDVDIAAFSCTLTFGTATRTRTGRSANELFATLIEAGVPSDSAAGHVYEAVHNLECKLDPTKLPQGVSEAWDMVVMRTSWMCWSRYRKLQDPVGNGSFQRDSIKRRLRGWRQVQCGRSLPGLPDRERTEI